MSMFSRSKSGKHHQDRHHGSDYYKNSGGQKKGILGSILGAIFGEGGNFSRSREHYPQNHGNYSDHNQQYGGNNHNNHNNHNNRRRSKSSWS